MFFCSQGQPLYTLHCNALSLALFDNLFHVDIKSKWWSHYCDWTGYFGMYDVNLKSLKLFVIILGHVLLTGK